MLGDIKGYAFIISTEDILIVLVFKWAETQLKLKSVLSLTPEKPLFGHKRGQTFWICFMKTPDP